MPTVFQQHLKKYASGFSYQVKMVQETGSRQCKWRIRSGPMPSGMKDDPRALGGSGAKTDLTFSGLFTA